VLLAGLVFAAPMALTAAPGGGLRFELPSSAGPVVGLADVFSCTLDPEAATGQLEVQASSLATGHGPRDQRLLVYALDVASFPAISFLARRIEGSLHALRAREGSGALRLAGPLRIRDVTVDALVAGTFQWESGTLRLRGEHPLVLADFGIPDPSVVLARVEPALRVYFDLAGSPG